MRRLLASGSPLVLAAACALLTLIIGSFAVNNYRREKALMTEALIQKGDTVIRFLETGVRVSMRAHRQSSAVGPADDWDVHVQGVIDQLQDQEDIHFVWMVDRSGRILAASDMSKIGSMVDDATLAFLHAGGTTRPVFRTVRQEDEGPGFQVVRHFANPTRGMVGPNGMPRGRMMENMRRMRPDFSQQRPEPLNGAGEEVMLLVQLDLAQFNSAVRRQLLQLATLSVVLLLVGAGGWLSLLTLQGYRGTQSRLRQIRAFNDLLVETLPLGLVATDSEGRIQLVNEAATGIIGLDGRTLLGRRPVEILPEVLVQALEAGGQRPDIVESREVSLEDGSGLRRNLFLTRAGIADDEGNLSGHVLLLQDVSKLRSLEDQLRRSERLAALGKMAAGVAHELRNPLSSIKGLAIVLKGRTDAGGRQTADVLVQEVERLNRSIGELLDYARPEKLQLQEIGVHQLLEKAVTLVGVDAEAQGIRILTGLGAVNQIVLADGDRMNQVLLNLMINSIQAMNGGGILHISTSNDNGWLLIDIVDDGEGIAPENLGKIFDPYFTTKSDGTGLGLALSAKIIEEHQGTISVDSSPGRGTTVQLGLRTVG